MANPISMLKLEPLKKEDLYDNFSPLNISEEELQLQTDVVNVLEGRVDIMTFEESYREKIKNYYRFSANRSTSSEYRICKLTRNTLDPV